MTRFPFPLPRITVVFAGLCLLTSTLRAAAPIPEAPRENTVALFGPAVAEGRNVALREDSAAYTGRHVSPRRNYEILATASLPHGGDVLHVWVRYRGLALQMKARVEGKTVEFPWNWTRNPDRFAWRHVGAFPREQLGEGVLFLCDTKREDNSGIDALVITADAAWAPPGATRPRPQAVATPPVNPDAPDAANATVQATVAVIEESSEPGEAAVAIDWSAIGPRVEPFIYSLNNFRGHSVARMSETTWHDGHAYMGTRLMRLHSSGLVRSWFDEETKDWKYDAVAAALVAGTPPTGAVRMICLNSWPASFDADEDGRLDSDRIDDFARLCADLVRFVNIERRIGILYWEVTNEKDFAYWRKPRNNNQPDVAAFARIYNQAAAAMRAVDPTIRIGGPAACSPLPVEPLVEFARLTHEQLDFFSFHHYATGSNTDSDQTIYEKAIVMASDSGDLIRRINAALRPHTGKILEYHLNEYNICYSWRVPEPRMTNHKGAVFDALSLISYAQVPGLTATNAWNDQDGVYGKMNNQGDLRPAAHVYHYFNRLLQGSRATVSTSDEKTVVPFAIADGSEGRPAFVLVNRTNGEQTVTLTETPVTSGSWRVASIAAEGLLPETAASPFAAPVTLAPHSVNFYWIN
ncbi:glycosyl hydrolase family 39 [Opitutaceae bacterium TAV5]|nr:glycosyl hydrolase family 39 [Opitutaceae bacterium TAV5]